MENYITDEVKALVGPEIQVRAWDVIERGAIRRFVQAIMDDDGIYWDDGYAKQTKYGGVVCPPLFPMYAFRQPPGTEDPLNEAIKNPQYHGGSFFPQFGLPDLPLPLKRRLNGGNEVEFFAYAKPGDRITARSRIVKAYQKEGRSGPMVFCEAEIVFEDQESNLLLINRQIQIRR